MGLDGAEGDEQLGRDLGVGAAPGNGLNDFDLPARQQCHGLPGGGASFLGPIRDLVLLIALGGLFPGQQVGTRAHPGSSIALNNFKLPMPAATAVLVILAWAIIPAVVGAWRTRTWDA